MGIRGKSKKRGSKTSRKPSKKGGTINPVKVRGQVRQFLKSPELNYLPKDKYERIVNLLKPYARFVKPKETVAVLAQLEGAKRIIEQEKSKARYNVYGPIIKEILQALGDPVLATRLEQLLSKVKKLKTANANKIKDLIEKEKEEYIKEKKTAIKELIDITKELSMHEDKELAALAKEINKTITLGARPSRYELEKLQEMGILLDPQKREKLEKAVKRVLEIYRP